MAKKNNKIYLSNPSFLLILMAGLPLVFFQNCADEISFSNSGQNQPSSWPSSVFVTEPVSPFGDPVSDLNSDGDGDSDGYGDGVGVGVGDSEIGNILASIPITYGELVEEAVVSPFPAGSIENTTVGSEITPEINVVTEIPAELPQAELPIEEAVCVEGTTLAIWLDPNQTGVPKLVNYLGSIVSYSGDQTAVNNYNYYSYSAHPKSGPVPNGFELNVFFYEGSDGLALNFFANIDEGGSSKNSVSIDIAISGNSKNDSVLLSDDSGEIKRVESSLSDSQYYHGRFDYWYNTDGAVIGPLTGNQYFIQAKIHSTGDVKNARFFSADGNSFSLHQESNNEISSFIIGFHKTQDCP